MGEPIESESSGGDEGLEEPAIWERNWAVFCHLGGFAGLLVPAIGQVLGVQFVFMVVASVAASHGELYRYPVTLRLIH